MSAIPILRKALLYGGLFAAALAIVGSVVGYLTVGPSGIPSALIGAVISAVFLGITALSILLASRYDILAFFSIVMGAWLLKFVVFMILAVILREQSWIHPTVMFLTLVAGVIGTLVVDVVVVAKSRLPYVSDISLPGDTPTTPRGR